MRWLSVLALLLLVCTACEKPPEPAPPETLEDVLRAMASAVAGQAPRKILDRVGHDFVTRDGLDFGGVQALVLEFLTREQRYEAEIESLVIEEAAERGVAGEPARRVRATVRFAPAGSFEATRYRLDLVFRQRLGRWMASSGSYQRLSRGSDEAEQG
ncbi:MAG: hypothetical protein ACE5IL_04505 [Myxococcota bacterium]